MKNVSISNVTLQFQEKTGLLTSNAVEIGVVLMIMTADKYHKILWLNYLEFVSLVAFLEYNYWIKIF